MADQQAYYQFVHACREAKITSMAIIITEEDIKQKAMETKLFYCL